LGAFSLLPGSSDISSSLKKKVLTRKFDLSGSRARLCTCSLLLGSLDVSFLLKEKVLTWNVDIRGQGHVYMLILFTRDLQSSFFTLRRKGLNLEGLSIRERKFDLRRVFHLGVILLLLRNDIFSLVGIPQK